MTIEEKQTFSHKEVFKKVSYVPIADGTEYAFYSFFQTTNGNTGNITLDLGSRSALTRFTAYVENDNLGPVYISAYVTVDGRKWHIAEGAIFDADGISARRVNWEGRIPLNSKKPENILNIDWSNYCGDNLRVNYNGVTM